MRKITPISIVFILQKKTLLKALTFVNPLSLGDRGGSCSSWSLQAPPSSATKSRCSGGMPRRDQLKS